MDLKIDFVIGDPRTNAMGTCVQSPAETTPLRKHMQVRSGPL